MPPRTLNVLHAIHDFLPRHQAGSELYAFHLCQELQKCHHVTVFCADYDPGRAHGTLTWRLHGGIPVVELVNTWQFSTVRETYDSPLIGARVAHVLDAVQPDVVHVHSLLNLCFDLPSLARARGAAVVATLHDYTLVCASGGQRLHREEQHVCQTIDVDRCARCFRESPFFDQMAVARAVPAGALGRLAGTARRVVPPALVARAARTVGRATGPPVTPDDMTRRLEAASAVFADIDLFVAPSGSLAEEYRRLGLDSRKIRVSDYGFPKLPVPTERPRSNRLRIGYVGSVVWHKGVHVLVDAVKGLSTSSWELTVWGSLDVSPDYVAELRRAATGLPIQFKGGFDHDQAADIYAEIDVLVVPSLWLENSPLVIHEAFMAGVPVVGSRIGGTADLVTDGVNGLLYEPDSPTALGAVLQTLLDDPERVARLTPNAGQVKSIADDASEWSNIYAEIAPDSSR